MQEDTFYSTQYLSKGERERPKQMNIVSPNIRCVSFPKVKQLHSQNSAPSLGRHHCEDICEGGVNISYIIIDSLFVCEDLDFF